MNQVTIKQLQRELKDTETAVAKTDQLVDAYTDKLEEAKSEARKLAGNRTAIRRLLKQNDALPEGTK